MCLCKAYLNFFFFFALFHCWKENISSIVFLRIYWWYFSDSKAESETTHLLSLHKVKNASLSSCVLADWKLALKTSADLTVCLLLFFFVCAYLTVFIRLPPLNQALKQIWFIFSIFGWFQGKISNNVLFTALCVLLNNFPIYKLWFYRLRIAENIISITQWKELWACHSWQYQTAGCDLNSASCK